MIKIFEKQQQVDNIENYQSRIVEFEDFQKYLDNVNEGSLPRENSEVGYKFVNFERQTIIFHYEHKLNGRWIEFVHFAQVIE